MQKLILASSSPHRLNLLKTIGITPDIIQPADIDESKSKGELPYNLALRLAQGKADKVANQFDDGYILAADSVAALGRRIMPKAITDELVRQTITQFSGRRHQFYTGIYIIHKESGQIIKKSSKIVKTIIKFKRLTKAEIEHYVSLQEGLDKASGYSIEGYAQVYISFISGSYSNVIGLPLCETRNILCGMGYEGFK